MPYKEAMTPAPAPDPARAPTPAAGSARHWMVVAGGACLMSAGMFLFLSSSILNPPLAKHLGVGLSEVMAYNSMMALSGVIAMTFIGPPLYRAVGVRDRGAARRAGPPRLPDPAVRRAVPGRRAVRHGAGAAAALRAAVRRARGRARRRRHADLGDGPDRRRQQHGCRHAQRPPRHRHGRGVRARLPAGVDGRLRRRGRLRAARPRDRAVRVRRRPAAPTMRRRVEAELGEGPAPTMAA